MPFFRLHFGEIDMSQSEEERKKYIESLVEQYQDRMRRRTKEANKVNQNQLSLFGKENCLEDSCDSSEIHALKVK